MKPTSGVSGQAKSTGADGSSKSEKPLSKRQKWMLKCRAKRLRRRERKKNSISESTAKVERTKAKTATRAVSFKLPTVGKQQLHNIPAPAVSCNHTQTRKLVLATGDEVGSMKVNVQRSDQHSTLKLSRKRKRKGAESNKEEEEFAKMVDKYRRKLQRTAA